MSASPLTEDAWIYGMPANDDITLVPIQLMLSQKYWQRFLKMVDNDRQLASEIISSLVFQNLEHWTGPNAKIAAPEVIADIRDIVKAKHRD